MNFTAVFFHIPLIYYQICIIILKQGRYIHARSLSAAKDKGEYSQ
jgi:hypothetical protein